MNKREFLTATALGAASLPAAARISKAAPRGPILLTVSGAIGNGNRGALDPALDQLMKKQGIHFSRAHVFDFAALCALPALRITPTLEYDGKQHALHGPLLTDVLHAAGMVGDAALTVTLRAIDGYAVKLPLADVKRYALIVATHLDRQPMALGGLGPLWAVYDADRVKEMQSRPLNERFGFCPWGLYHIEVQPA